MKFKIVDNGYICGIGIGNTGTAITDEEYAEIMAMLPTKPETTATKDYRLKTDLTWEPYEVEPVPEPEPEPDDAEYATAGKILMGVEE